MIQALVMAMQAMAIVLFQAAPAPQSASAPSDDLAATARRMPQAEAWVAARGASVFRFKTLALAAEWAKPFGVGVKSGEEAVVEIRPLFDASDFDPGKGVQRAKGLGEPLGTTTVSPRGPGRARLPHLRP
jgi:hypothetical protein